MFWVLGAKHRLTVILQRLGGAPLGLGILAHLLQDRGQIAFESGNVWVLGAEHLLADRQRALVERPRLSIGRKRRMPV